MRRSPADIGSTKAGEYISRLERRIEFLNRKSAELGPPNHHMAAELAALEWAVTILTGIRRADESRQRAVERAVEDSGWTMGQCAGDESQSGVVLKGETITTYAWPAPPPPTFPPNRVVREGREGGGWLPKPDSRGPAEPPVPPRGRGTVPWWRRLLRS